MVKKRKSYPKLRVKTLLEESLLLIIRLESELR